MKFLSDSGTASKIIALLDNDEAGRTVAAELKQLGLEDVQVIFGEPYFDRVLDSRIRDRFGSYESYRTQRYPERLRFVRESVEGMNRAELKADPQIEQLIREIGRRLRGDRQ